MKDKRVTGPNASHLVQEKKHRIQSQASLAKATVKMTLAEGRVQKFDADVHEAKSYS